MGILIKLKQGFPEVEKALPYLNHGGCLLFAYSLKIRLRELGYNCEVVAVGADFDHYIKDMECNGINTAYRKSLKIKDLEHMPAPHFVVRIGALCVDSDGSKPYKQIKKYVGISEPISDKTAVLLIHNEELWNPMFRIHNEHIDRLRKIQVLVKRYLK